MFRVLGERCYEEKQRRDRIEDPRCMSEWCKQDENSVSSKPQLQDNQPLFGSFDREKSNKGQPRTDITV
jgi:hypothetical protein